MKALDARQIQWLRERIRMAFDLRACVEELRRQGHSDDAIFAGIDLARPLGSVLADGAMQLPPLIRRAPPTLRNIGAPKLDLYALDDFLSPKECARLIALIAHHLQPSMLSSEAADKDFRTSMTAQLCELRSPQALAIDAKICRTLGIRAEYSEGIQAQRYEVGGQFKPHWDYFAADTSDRHRSACSVRGNRTWTFMVYLNEDMEGGATRFTEIDLAVQPKTGMALLWNNLQADGTPNSMTRHCGEPVTRGHKIIITKWFRVRGDGPIFHD